MADVSERLDRIEQRLEEILGLLTRVEGNQQVLALADLAGSELVQLGVALGQKQGGRPARSAAKRPSYLRALPAGE